MAQVLEEEGLHQLRLQNKKEKWGWQGMERNLLTYS
jgi:hypothetical protein